MSENNVEFKEPNRLTTWIKYLLCRYGNLIKR
ncbi:hypothetical protein BZA03_11346 [Alteromonas sp. I10]|nr:hypothetical protein BZA03_11346 [Alteromonas sp. I10]